MTNGGKRRIIAGKIAGVANEEFIVEAENIEREENETALKFFCNLFCNFL